MFSQLSFSVRTGQKLAVIGANETGKTTLLSMIYNSSDGIKISQRAKVGYFHQSLVNLDPNLSILENVQKSSIYSLTIIQTALARLQFHRDAVHSLDDPRPVLFTGAYPEYLEKKNQTTSRDDRKEQILLFETKLTELISQLSLPAREMPSTLKEELENEYLQTLEELRKWKTGN